MSARGLAARAQDALIAAVGLAALAVVAPWPFRALRAGGAALGLALSWYRRRHVDAALARAGIAPEIARRVYRSLATGLLELLWTIPRAPSGMAARVRLTPRAEAALAAAGDGAVVATAHSGNWDLVACAVAHRAPLVVVTKRLSNAWLDGLWMRARARHGVRFVSDGVLARGLVALRARSLLAVLVDQRPVSRRVVRHDFLGAPADSDVLPAVLAKRANKRLIVALARRLPSGELEVDVPRVFLRVDDAEEVTRRVAEEVERFVRAHPEGWLWTHRRWAA
ncbi:MAG: lysophospholipid acyltransferase family protein [Polyangiaceae bacterium]|nr:lysophospholipid acyltransferase family protein [Polyangiaceae bacterium]